LVLGIIATIAHNNDRIQQTAKNINGYFITGLSNSATVTENTIAETVIIMLAFWSAIIFNRI
jgi:hypothetical protein